MIHRGWYGISALSALLTLSSMAAAQNQPAAVELRPDWEPGQQSRYRFEQTRQRQRTLSVGGQQRKVDTTTKITGEMTWRVESVQSIGGATGTLRYDWLRMRVTGPQGETQINDSREGSGDSAAAQNLIEAMTQTPIEVEVNADGTIESVSGGEAIRSAVENEALAPSDRSLRRTAESLAIVPAAPRQLRPGDTWSHPFTESHPLGEMNYDATYELAGVETIASIPVATVEIDAAMTLEQAQPDRAPQGAEVSSRLSDSDYRSFVIFDLMRHETVGRYTRDRQVVEQSISARGRTMRQSMVQQVEVTTLRIDEK